MLFFCKLAVFFYLLNCNFSAKIGGSASKRELYVNALSKYLQVDIYGKCGNESICPRTTRSCRDDIFEELGKKYW